MLVTISGPPGSGTSTAAAALANRFDLEHISGGDIFRDLAAERDMTVEAFNTLAETDDRIDLELDERLRNTAVDRDDVVLESRLAGWMAGEQADLRFWLTAPIDVRASRIAEREGWTVDEALERTEMREESERNRYAQYYDIDFTDLSIYDLSINTGRWRVEAELDLLTLAVDTHRAGGNEGAIPVTGVTYAFE